MRFLENQREEEEREQENMQNQIASVSSPALPLIFYSFR
jgi:hypothetical protein